MTGAKSRVETQIKLCVQLVTEQGDKVHHWSYLRLPDEMLVRSKQKRTLQKSRIEGALPTLLSEESNILTLEAKVICASQEDKEVRMCEGCMKRERKRAERSKDGKMEMEGVYEPQEENEATKTERDRILLFNCGPMISFSSGDVILPTRITCYCRHHNEKVGFRVRFTMRNHHGQPIAIGDSPPILITDDHKSAKQRGRKRSKDEMSDTFAPSRCTSVSMEDNVAYTTHPLDISQSTGTSNSTSTSTSTSTTTYSQATLTPMDEFSHWLHPLATSDSYPIESLSLNTPLNDTWSPHKIRKTHGYEHTLAIETPVPHLERIVPNQGPTYGGIEITLLGSGFSRHLTCLFGEQVATTVYCNSNTIVCILPPIVTPGPVTVTFQDHSPVLERQVTLFTYYDANDQALLELALQVVGLKMTGKLQNAKQVAMHIVQGDTKDSNAQQHTHAPSHPKQSYFSLHSPPMPVLPSLAPPSSGSQACLDICSSFSEDSLCSLSNAHPFSFLSLDGVHKMLASFAPTIPSSSSYHHLTLQWASFLSQYVAHICWIALHRLKLLDSLALSPCYALSSYIH
ncbi:hypothetical protein BDF14DRAFT_1803290 [Spinellus fusiger]|nr:hypothetical protein BDF14DRAFT_1803290 [Spinellus fusiger]